MSSPEKDNYFNRHPEHEEILEKGDVTTTKIALQQRESRVSAAARLICSIVFVSSAFLAHVLTTGVSFTTGVYYVTFLEEFGQSNGLTAWIGSLNFGSLCAAGPLAGYLVNHYGCGVTLFIGGIVSCAGLLISALATSIYTLFLTYGIIAGAGFGIVFAASISLMALEFDKWRKLAMGISLSGVGVGTCFQPLMAHYFINELGWRGALILTGGLVLHTCVIAMLVRVTLAIRHETKPCAVVNFDAEKSKLIEANFQQDIVIEDGKHKIWTLKYLVVHINVLLYCFGQSVIYTHLISYTSYKGHSIKTGSLLISLLGISNVFGRAILGAISQHPCVNVTVLYIICYAFAGACCLLYCLSSDVIIMIILTLLIGFAISAFGPLLGEIVCEVVGAQSFALGYGYLMISMAAGTLLGAPAAGWVYDVTIVYGYSFVMSGTSLILSATVMLVTLFI